MSKGYWAGEAIATGLELAAAENGRVVTLEALRGLRRKYDALSKEYDERANAAEAELDQTSRANAANIAEKQVLRNALAKFDPKHPLLTNAHLRERIHDVGERAYSINRNYDDAAAAGRNFKY